MEFEEQRRCHRIGGLRVAVHRVHLDFVQQLDACDGDPELDCGNHRVDSASNRLERTDRRGHGLGQRMEPDGHFGHDAERALRSDEQAGQVVACGRLPRARAGAYHATIGQDDGEREDVLAHRAVPDRCRARGACRCHSTDRRVRARIDRKHEAGAAKRSGQLLARHACFDRRVEILSAHSDHAVHLAKIDRDSSAKRVHVALERRACTERDHRELKSLADPEDCGDLPGAGREADQVRRRRRMV